MTQATRIDNDEALRLALNGKLTENHVLVTSKGRFKTEHRNEGVYRFWYGEGHLDFMLDDELAALIHFADAHVELETPSPFDDEAFEGWFSSVTGGKEEYKSLKSATITQSGTITVDTFAVPIDQIPEAARHINALLALGEK